MKKYWIPFILLEAAIIVAFRINQPQCEPCIDNWPCPPCITDTQITLRWMGIVLVICFVAWQFIRILFSKKSK